MEPNVSEDDLKRAYRRAAMKRHPDKNVNNVKHAENKFKKIQQAYDALRDPRSRGDYDHNLMEQRRLRPQPNEPGVFAIAFSTLHAAKH